MYAIVERLPEPKPVCTWPGRPGVLTLSKGWVAVNADGRVWFYNKKPHAVFEWGKWDLVIAGGGMARQLGHGLFTDLPVFNPDLPWTEHIVEVGWEETVVVKDQWNATTSRIADREIEDVIDDYVEIGPILSASAELEDGWVAEDANKSLYWFSVKPSTKHSWLGEWLMVGEAGSSTGEAKKLNSSSLMGNQVIFPYSMPWDQRIVRIVNNQIVRHE